MAMKHFWFSIKTCFKASPFLCVLLISVFSFCAALGGVLLTAQKNLIDGITQYYSGNIVLSKVTVFVIFFLIIYSVRIFLYNTISNFISHKIKRKVQVYIQEQRVKKMMSIKYEYFEQDKTLDMFERSKSADNRIFETFYKGSQFVDQIVSVVSYNIVLFILSPTFAYICIGLGIFSAFIIYLKSRIDTNTWYHRSTERRKLDMILSIWQGEKLSFNQAEQRIFLTSDKMSGYTYKNSVNLNKKITSSAKINIILSVIAELAASGVSIAIILYIVLTSINGSLAWTIGEITIAITGYASLVRKLSNASTYASTMFVLSKQANGFIELMNLEEESNNKINIVPEEKTIHIKNLCFTYPGTDKEILHNVTFDINISEHIAFVGRNGSGKSTMVKLLLGLYRPTSGDITIGGHSISEYSYDVRRKIFGIQFQDYMNYPFKIRETVAVGNPEILNKDDEIEFALKSANIYDALIVKDITLDTPVGKEYDNNAIELSGGEKQRLSLATTMSYDHDYLLLDEPTAALDAIGENKMYESFMSGIKDKGSLIVSHRLASARISDRILVFENGEIVQDGNHNDLIKDKESLYYKMFTAQSKLYKKEGEQNESNYQR